MSWECFPLNYLSHDLLHPSNDEGLPFLHWELKQMTSLVFTEEPSCPEEIPASPASCPEEISSVSCPEEVSPTTWV